MIVVALGLWACAPQAGGEAEPTTRDTATDTGAAPDTGEQPVCGPDDLRLAEQTFCAPDFTLPDHTGADVTRSDLEGHILIVEVIAMWCDPCREVSTSVMEPLYEAYRDDGLRIVSIVAEDAAFRTPSVEDAAAWRSSLDLQYIVVADIEGEVAPDWDRGGVVPMSYVLDQDGVVTWFANGRGTLEQFTREVELLLP